jgi:hypothetical protein
VLTSSWFAHNKDSVLIDVAKREIICAPIKHEDINNNVQVIDNCYNFMPCIKRVDTKYANEREINNID